MTSMGEYLSGTEQQQQQNINSVVGTDALFLSIGNMSEINMGNITNRNQNDSTNYLTDDLELTSLSYNIIFGLVCACLCFLTITGNLLVLITFRRMRTVGNLFILSLATADLIVGCFVMPIAGIYAIMEKWRMGLTLCQIWISVDFIASTASIFNLLTLSLDRYWSITSPLQYLGKRTRTRALLLIGFAWGLSLLWVIPIFGWHHLNHGKRSVSSDKCEPEFTGSKGFKVSTAIINFYLPLLVLISLNGRIYYEIKRRYKNVLLQRHSNKTNDSTVTNTNFYNRKLNKARNSTRSPITMTLCDSDRQLCSTTANLTENDSLTVSKFSPKSPTSNPESVLRINFKERKNRPITPIQISDNRKLSLQRTYSYVDKSHCTQDELSWFAQRREHSHSSFTQTSPTTRSSYKYDQTRSHRLNVDERCFKHTNDYNSCRIYSNRQALNHTLPDSASIYNQHHYQSSFRNTTTRCRRCSVLDSIKTSPPPTTMNVFNLCHCCSAATSAITVSSNPFVNNQTNSNIDSCNQIRKISSSSSSSVAHSSLNRKPPQQQSLPSSLNKGASNTTLNLIARSNSQLHDYRASNKVQQQTTVWNQQEKAFRQLFAIVFGFTCCFLPYFILYMVVAFCGSCVSERVVTATIWLGYVNSTMNPFLYALSNKHFRRTFHRLLKRDNRRQSHYN